MTTAEDLQRGRLEQACPDCGRWEAAGSYCSGCDRAMGPDDWYPNGSAAGRARARQKAPLAPRTPPKGRLEPNGGRLDHHIAA
jgi:hypothetical protein